MEVRVHWRKAFWYIWLAEIFRRAKDVLVYLILQSILLMTFAAVQTTSGKFKLATGFKYEFALPLYNSTSTSCSDLSMTHRGRVTHVRVSKLGHHWFREGLVAYSATIIDYTVEWNLGNKFQFIWIKLRRFCATKWIWKCRPQDYISLTSMS